MRQGAPFQPLTFVITVLDLVLDLFEELPGLLYASRGPKFLAYTKGAQCL